MTNKKDTNDHKLQLFPNYIRRGVIDWFTRYEMAHLTTIWDEVQRAFISQLNEIRNEGQAVASLRYAKQTKYEFIEDYYDNFLRLYTIIPHRPHDIYLKLKF